MRQNPVPRGSKREELRWWGVMVVTLAVVLVSFHLRKAREREWVTEWQQVCSHARTMIGFASRHLWTVQRKYVEL